MAKTQNGRNVKINSDAKEFAKATMKRYKKDSGDYFDSKKELKSSYELYLIDLLPEAIDFVVKYGYINNEEVQEVKTGIFQKLTDPDFVSLIKKELKRGNDIKNIKLLPIIIKEILAEGQKVNNEALAENPNAKIYDLTDIAELSRLILKKKIKKFEKAGINSQLAFNVLSIVPHKSALENSQFYRIHSLYDTLYESAKSVAVPFDVVMDILVPEDYYLAFITFALLERKEKFMKLTDSQKELYLAISNWCFSTMNKLKKDELESVLKTYVAGRKKDDEAGRDGNRRYVLSSLSEDEYPNIHAMVSKMIAKDGNVKKYL